MELTERMLKHLRNQGITYIYIQDSVTDDVHIQPVLSDGLRRKATIKDIFADVKQNGLSKRLYIVEKRGKQLTKIVDQIMNEIMKRKETLSMLADIFATDDYFLRIRFSLNVTIYSMAIGTELQ